MRTVREHLKQFSLRDVQLPSVGRIHNATSLTQLDTRVQVVRAVRTAETVIICVAIWVNVSNPIVSNSAYA